MFTFLDSEASFLLEVIYNTQHPGAVILQLSDIVKILLSSDKSLSSDQVKLLLTILSNASYHGSKVAEASFMISLLQNGRFISTSETSTSELSSGK